MIDVAGCCARHMRLSVKGGWWGQRRTQVIGVTGCGLGHYFQHMGVIRKGDQAFIWIVTVMMWQVRFEKMRSRSSPAIRRGKADRTYPVEDLWLCGWWRGVARCLGSRRRRTLVRRRLWSERLWVLCGSWSGFISGKRLVVYWARVKNRVKGARRVT